MNERFEREDKKRGVVEVLLFNCLKKKSKKKNYKVFHRTNHFIGFLIFEN